MVFVSCKQDFIGWAGGQEAVPSEDGVKESL